MDSSTVCNAPGRLFTSPESPVTGHHSLPPVAAFRRSRYNSFVPPVSQTVRVKVLFFGRLKDVIGQSEESLDLNEASTIEQLFALYSERIPELAKYRSSVVASRNQEFAAWDTMLHSGDEVAFLPPVSGG
jgi:sulfur-carrier protein